MTDEHVIYNEDEDLMSEDERQALLADQYIVEDDAEASPFKPMAVPKGRFYSDAYVHPDVPRDIYIRDVYAHAQETRYDGYEAFESDSIHHSDLMGGINFYHPVLIRVLPIMKSYYGQGHLYIINGFRHAEEVGVNSHATGLAVDIHVTSQDQARRLMSAAYIAGIPTILPVGNAQDGSGHVHLDMAPPADFTYDSGKYSGPWS